MTIKYEPSILY